MHSKLIGLFTLTLTSSVHAVTWQIAQNYSGSTFFDAWTYQNGIDANTTGNVLFQTREQAMQEQLTFVNAAGNAIIKVDNTTSGAGDPTFGRPSVKLLSNATVPMGSLTIMDAVHMPFGCSVWPGYWMEGPNWPDDGEIDIVENVNLATNNQYALHTLQGCMHPSAADSANIETGILAQADCFNATNNNEGCLVKDPSTSSYGAGFVQNGGGVFAVLWDDTGINIWFFNRSSIPSDVATDQPNPAGWPLPTASYPSSSCDTAKFFTPQTIIIDISICGNFAGLPSIFNPTCPGLCTDMVATPSNYDNAYFEISYIRVFTNGTSKTGTSSGVPQSGSPGSGGGSGSGGANGVPHSATSLLTLLAAVGFPVVIALFTIAL
jgi:uncharacterized membrane protein YgcG